MRWIYISPHFDDAILSCGGLIWEQANSGIPVEIWTINAGNPPQGAVSDLITRVHAVWRTGSPQETVALRRLEDENAAAKVGAKTRHFNNVDAIYRRTSTGTLMYTQDVFDPIYPREAGIVEETALQIARELNETDIIVSPLALGGHVDHVITRRAVDTLGPPIWYYADIPYLFDHEKELQPAVEGLKPKTFAVSEKGLTAWQDGIAAYESQITSLFKDLDDMREHIKAYSASRQGLTIWHSA